MAAKLRGWLILTRGSNLPTVWSSVLVGWLAATYGDGRSSSLSYFPGMVDAKMVDYAKPASTAVVFWPLAWLLLAVSAIYVGGMILNDAFDADWDARHRPSRPIPSGAVSRGAALGVGFALLFGGACGAVLVRALRLAELSELTAGGVGPVAVLALGLVAAVLVYDRWHKGVAWAPVVMGLCRALLPLLGAAVASGDFLATLGTWPGAFLLLGAATLWGHTFGLTWVARHEATDGKPPAWTAWAIFVVPLPLALTAGLGPQGCDLLAWPLLGLFALWIWSSNRRHPLPAGVPGRVSDRLAASPFLDYLILGRPLLWITFFVFASGDSAAVVVHPTHLANLVPFGALALFGPLACFGLTLLFRRWIPQT
jgi:4-hydroxybenzoate polyprenyltransferase